MKTSRFVSKTNIVYKGVFFEDSFENYLNKESISICQFLYFLCIEDIAEYVERTYYTNKYWHFKYNVSSLIKLFIVKCFRKLSYDKTVIVISHYADFLNCFTEGVIYLDAYTKKIESYVGDYFSVVEEIAKRIKKSGLKTFPETTIFFMCAVTIRTLVPTYFDVS